MNSSKKKLLRQKIQEKKEQRLGHYHGASSTNVTLGLSKESQKQIRDNFEINATQMDMLNTQIQNGHIKNESEVMQFMIKHKIRSKMLLNQNKNKEAVVKEEEEITFSNNDDDDDDDDGANDTTSSSCK